MHTYLSYLWDWGKSWNEVSGCFIHKVEFLRNTECFPNKVACFTLAVYIIYQAGTGCSGHLTLPRSTTNLPRCCVIYRTFMVRRRIPYSLNHTNIE